MDINTIINVIAIILAVGNFICLYNISKKKSYYEEKGKNLATKEDIAGITKEIESVKDSYNKSLEKHKIELQKEFESHKYILKLCQSIDSQLILLTSNCLKANAEKGIDNDDSKLLGANYDLCNFLITYKGRYEDNLVISQLIERSIDIHMSNMNDEFRFVHNKSRYQPNEIPQADKDKLLDSLEAALSLFLPDFCNDKPEH